jgi:hypothetical protein
MMNAKSPPKDDIATRIMTAMIKMPPKLHKDDLKPLTNRGEGQRRRREREREQRT